MGIVIDDGENCGCCCCGSSFTLGMRRLFPSSTGVAIGLSLALCPPTEICAGRLPARRPSGETG
jgi:hypothetical protein